MINVKDFVSTLTTAGIDFFCGVPDSLLKSFCAYITDLSSSGRAGSPSMPDSSDGRAVVPPTAENNIKPPITHIITANEGGAIALASGHYLATGKPALVYMQNSGEGNAVNPLASLADPDVYSIPMILLIGWRGMPGVHDEPQHVKQGKITIELMETLGIPTWVLPDLSDDGRAVVPPTADWRTVVSTAISTATRESRPVALIVKKGLFEPYKLQTLQPDIAALKREDAIEAVLESIGSDSVVVSTTGMISRELYETRLRLGQGHERDFLTVGSMGHALMIALGIAKDSAESKPGLPVVCLDGDGASIMQMGNMAIAGQARQPNLIHIVLNNAAHDSVGGQPTVGGAIDLCKIAEACGYYVAAKIEGGTKEEVKAILRERIDQAIYSWACDPAEDQQTTFIEIRVAKGSRPDLGRPKEPPQVNKSLFMQTLGVTAQ